MAFHISPATGIVIPCHGETHCEPGEATYPTRAEALEARELSITIQHGGAPQHYDYSFDAPLELAVEHGFRRASPGEDLESAQVSMLLHPQAVHAITRSLKYLQRDKVRRRVGRALAWIAKELGARQGVDIRRSYLENIAPHLHGEENIATFMEALMAREATPGDLLHTSASLWMSRSSPFHGRAKYLLFSGSGTPTGYTPQNNLTTARRSTAEIAGKLGVDSTMLPRGVLAFDLETDTRNGFGLLPMRSQITEIVLSDAQDTLVLSGDERMILEAFRDELNSRARSGAFTLAGWNNHLFDNIFLQSRAEHHLIHGWRGRLSPVENSTPFEPCGPTGVAHSFSWGDSSMEDVDLFQERARQNALGGNGHMDSLKDFLSAHDAHPIRVERNTMHLLGDEERLDYALSDGICTLRAHSLLLG